MSSVRSKPSLCVGTAPWHGSNWNEQQLGLHSTGPSNAITGDLKARLSVCAPVRAHLHVFNLWLPHTIHLTISKSRQELISIQQQQGDILNKMTHLLCVHHLMLCGRICKNILKCIIIIYKVIHPPSWEVHWLAAVWTYTHPSGWNHY